MKIAILSDIHGNISALKQVIKIIDKESIDIIFSLGDQLGYYYHAEEVYQLLRDRSAHLIKGNHENIYLAYLKDKEMFLDQVYGKSFEKYAQSFPKELNDYISNLPISNQITIDNISFCLYHGSSLNPDEYIYPTTEKKQFFQFRKNSSKVILLGHTHYPMIYQMNSSLIINPGSVGQSRITGGIADWGVYNTTNQVYTPRSTPYCVSHIEESLIGYENTYLYKVLRRRNE